MEQDFLRVSIVNAMTAAAEETVELVKNIRALESSVQHVVQNLATAVVLLAALQDSQSHVKPVKAPASSRMD
ncbi:MAG: hypothetical protein ACRD2L_01490 [Terriglobia bacterium]